MNIEELKKRAAAGDAEAQYKLGECYYNGDDIKQDDEAAVLWFKESARQGYVPAYRILGECYNLGYGVEQDLEEAVKWYRLAAEKGNEDAKEALKDLQNGKSRGKIYKNREIQ